VAKKSAKKKRKSAPGRTKNRSKSAPKQRKSKPLKRKSSSSKSMAKKKSSKSRSSGSAKGIKGIFKRGMVKDVVAGIGAGTLAGIAVNMVAPQFSGIAKPISAFLAGGPVGVIASVILDGGLGSFGFGGPVKTELSV